MRKLIFMGTMGALLALLFSACGGGSSGTVSISEESNVNAACEEEPVSGGSLVYSRQLETVTLNPREVKNGNGDIFADEMLYAGLVRNDPTGLAKVVPGL